MRYNHVMAGTSVRDCGTTLCVLMVSYFQINLCLLYYDVVVFTELYALVDYDACSCLVVFESIGFEDFLDFLV